MITSTLVVRWRGEGRQSMHWRAGQPFRWASTGCQKCHEAQERKMQSPGALKRRYCRVLRLGLGWLKRITAGKNFQVLMAASETAVSSEPIWWWRIILYWAVLLHHGQGKGWYYCSLPGNCVTMPGKLHLALGFLSTERKAKKSESVSMGYQDVFSDI